MKTKWQLSLVMGLLVAADPVLSTDSQSTDDCRDAILEAIEEDEEGCGDGVSTDPELGQFLSQCVQNIFLNVREICKQHATTAIINCVVAMLLNGATANTDSFCLANSTPPVGSESGFIGDDGTMTQFYRHLGLQIPINHNFGSSTYIFNYPATGY